jgi:foldase protein PrsA
MKFTKLAGLLLASTMVLTGCSSSSTAVKDDDGKYVIASITDKNITADDLYANLLATPSGQSSTFNFVLQKLIDTYFPVDKDIKEYAENAIENIESSYESSYGDDYETQLESALAQSGFETMDDYKEYLIQSLQYSNLVKDYVKNNFDTVFEDYYKYATPRFIEMIKVSVSDMDNPTDEETEKLEEVKALLKSDKSFEDIAADYSDDEDSASAKGSLGVVDTSTGLADDYGDNVEETALSLKSGKVSGAIEGDDGYYFLKCTSTDKDKIKEELKTVDLNSPLLAYDNYIIYDAFETYELTYEDEDIQKMIEDFVKEAKETREESRGNS